MVKRGQAFPARQKHGDNSGAVFGRNWQPQLKSHLAIGKEHGVTKTEVVEIVTQLAFYCGWPKAWSTFPLIEEVYGEDEGEEAKNLSVFPVGEKNDAFAKYFIGQSYLAPVSTSQVPVFNVTFEPACRNNWHIHHAKNGGGQMLICVAGRGWYQEYGKEPRELHPGDVVNIPAEVKHWHGAGEGTHGSSTLRLKFPERKPERNGANPWGMRNIIYYLRLLAPSKRLPLGEFHLGFK